MKHTFLTLVSIVTALALSIVCSRHTSLADAPPAQADAYWSSIEETRLWLETLSNPISESEQKQLHAIAERLNAMTTVVLSDGSTMPIEHSFLVAHLAADPPDLELLINLCDALLEARDAWSRPVQQTLDHGELDRILARPEFQWPEERPSPLQEWLQELSRRFSDLLSNLLPNIDSGGIPFLDTILAVLSVLILVIVLVYTFRGVLSNLVTEAEARSDTDENERQLTSATALKRAQTLSAGGNYRTAVRYLYLSSLLLMEERGLLRYDRSRTNREYLGSVAHVPQLAQVFGQVVDVFDRVWYGYQPLDEATFDEYAAFVAKLRQVCP